jgi:hypothetical protein
LRTTEFETVLDEMARAFESIRQKLVADV